MPDESESIAWDVLEGFARIVNTDTGPETIHSLLFALDQETLVKVTLHLLTMAAAGLQLVAEDCGDSLYDVVRMARGPDR